MHFPKKDPKNGKHVDIKALVKQELLLDMKYRAACAEIPLKKILNEALNLMNLLCRPDPHYKYKIIRVDLKTGLENEVFIEAVKPF